MPYKIMTCFEQIWRGSSWRVQDVWHGMTQLLNADYNYQLFVDAKTKFDVAQKTACFEFILQETKDLNTSEARDFGETFEKCLKQKKATNWTFFER